MTRNIGIVIKNPPTRECSDPYCPYHGTLPVRGRVIEGVVISTKMHKTVTVKREYMWYVKKYKRYEARTSKIKAHVPDCIDVKEGDRVKIAECRPLSKTVAFVVVENLSGG